jgi:hypothetical protein
VEQEGEAAEHLPLREVAAGPDRCSNPCGEPFVVRHRRLRYTSFAPCGGFGSPTFV